MKSKNAVTINFRITKSVKEALTKMAANDRRTLSDYLRIRLEEIIKNNKKK